jgi:hypothetical protein
MAKKFLTANYNDGDHNVKVGLTLILWEEIMCFINILQSWI